MAGGGIRAARNLSAGAVAAIAAWSSYSHMVHVALLYGERPEVAYALPCSVDGMLVVSTIIMVDDKRGANRVRPMARLAFAAGVIASIAANIAAAHPTIGARIVDAWPALALLLVVEMLARPPATAATESATSTNAHTVQPPPAELVTAARTAQVPVEVPPADVPPARQLPPLPAEAAAASALRAAPGSPTQGRDLQLARASHGPARRGPVLDSPLLTDRSAAKPVIDADLPASTGTPGRHPANTSATPRDTAAPAEPASVVVPAEVPVPAEPARAVVPAEVPHAPRDRTPTAQRKDPAVGGDASLASDAAAANTSSALRRPAATTRRLARGIMAAEPHLSRTEVANRLGVSTRRLREVLAA